MNCSGFVYIVMLMGAMHAASCSPKPLPALAVPDVGTLANETGEASCYPDGLHGLATANGETYDTTQFTAAHRTLPFGTRVTVTNLVNNTKVTVRINDRGPTVPGHIIHISKAAARKLGILNMPAVTVKIRYKD